MTFGGIEQAIGGIEQKPACSAHARAKAHEPLSVSGANTSALLRRRADVTYQANCRLFVQYLTVVRIPTTNAFGITCNPCGSVRSTI